MEDQKTEAARPETRPGIVMNRLAIALCGTLLFMAGVAVGRGGLRAEHLKPAVKADYETFYS